MIIHTLLCPFLKKQKTTYNRLCPTSTVAYDIYVLRSLSILESISIERKN
jgi:hypothetical protein